MKVVIYSRISSDGNRQVTEQQIQELHKVAERAGYEVLKDFCDFNSEDFSKTNCHSLENCMQFCADKKNGVGCLMIPEVGCLGSDPLEFVPIIKYFRDIKVNLYFRDNNLALIRKNGKENELFSHLINMYLQCTKQEQKEVAKQRLQTGYKNFRTEGGKVGRKPGFRKTEEQYLKEYGEAICLLKKGETMKKTATLCDISESTVLRLKRRFNIFSPKKLK